MALCYHLSMATTLRLSDEDQAVLSALAAEEHVSANEVVRRAILERAARRGHAARVEAGFAESEQRWAGLLERLREA